MKGSVTGLERCLQQGMMTTWEIFFKMVGMLRIVN